MHYLLLPPTRQDLTQGQKPEGRLPHIIYAFKILQCEIYIKEKSLHSLWCGYNLHTEFNE